MKKYLRSALLCAMTAVLLGLTACQSPSPAGSSQEPAASSSSAVSGDAASGSADVPSDRPTIPDGIPEDMHYLYDLSFSQRYDDRITDQFSLTLPDGNTFRLFEKYQYPGGASSRFGHDGDGMVPHEYSYYWYNSNDGALMIGTDDYVPDQVEYISYLWSNLPGTKTDLGVAVGSTERELLAYTDELFFVEFDEAITGVGSGFQGYGPIYNEDGYYQLDPRCEFDYAYLFQPSCDIMFYMKDGAVVAIETMHPFEARHVYGYDREAGLRETETRRAALS